MDAEPLITRDEMTAYLFRVSDIAEDVRAILELLIEPEGDDGEEEEDLG